jgi:hypothetical protein
MKPALRFHTPPGCAQMRPEVTSILTDVIIAVQANNCSAQDIIDISASLLITSLVEVAQLSRKKQLLAVAQFHQRLEQIINGSPLGSVKKGMLQ